MPFCEVLKVNGVEGRSSNQNHRLEFLLVGG